MIRATVGILASQGGIIPLLLDTYTGAAAAYSLRLLRSAYTGDAIRVRRASDNTEQDIGFVSNELDTSALTTFCSGTNGFVKTWYDQSGNANNATQTTAASQPQIVSSGSVILDNGKATVKFNGSPNSLIINTAVTITNHSIFCVNTVNGTITSGSPAQILLSGSSQGTGFREMLFGYGNLTGAFTTEIQYFTSRVTSPIYGYAQIAENVSGQRLNSMINVSNTSFSFYRNSSLMTLETSTTGGFTASTEPEDIKGIGYRFAGNSIYYNGKFQEIIIYNSDQSSNITGIETNINDFYSIY
jgi:hypothetical protein